MKKYTHRAKKRVCARAHYAREIALAENLTKGITPKGRFCGLLIKEIAKSKICPDEFRRNIRF